MLHVWWTCQRGASVSRQSGVGRIAVAVTKAGVSCWLHTYNTAVWLRNCRASQNLRPFLRHRRDSPITPITGTEHLVDFFFFFLHFRWDHRGFTPRARQGFPKTDCFGKRTAENEPSHSVCCFFIESKPCSVKAASRYGVIYEIINHIYRWLSTETLKLYKEVLTLNPTPLSCEEIWMNTT